MSEIWIYLQNIVIPLHCNLSVLQFILKEAEALIPSLFTFPAHCTKQKIRLHKPVSKSTCISLQKMAHQTTQYSYRNRVTWKCSKTMKATDTSLPTLRRAARRRNSGASEADFWCWTRSGGRGSQLRPASLPRHRYSPRCWGTSVLSGAPKPSRNTMMPDIHRIQNVI